VKQAGFAGWSTNPDGDRLVRKEIRRVLNQYGLPPTGALFDKTYGYVAESRRTLLDHTQTVVRPRHSLRQDRSVLPRGTDPRRGTHLETMIRFTNTTQAI